jgi:hypothetical protein
VPIFMWYSSSWEQLVCICGLYVFHVVFRQLVGNLYASLCGTPFAGQQLVCFFAWYSWDGQQLVCIFTWYSYSRGATCMHF